MNSRILRYIAVIGIGFVLPFMFGCLVFGINPITYEFTNLFGLFIFWGGGLLMGGLIFLTYLFINEMIKKAQ